MSKIRDVNNNGGSGIVWLGVKLVVLAVQAAVSMMLILSIITTGILKTGVIVAVIAGLLLIFALCLFFLVLRKKTSLAVQIVCLVVSVLVSVVGVFAMRYTDAFSNFLGKITSDGRELKKYSVLVLEESDIREVKQLDYKSAGFLATDTTAKLAEEELKKQAEVSTNTYESVSMIDQMMDSNLLDAMVLENSRMEALEEDMDDLFNDKRVIYTFSIEIIGEDEETGKEITEEPFLVYISGSDSRSGIKATARSDVNILAAVNPKTGKILLASIPRDTYVQLHGTTGLKDKLTHAGIYGINMSKETIEDLVGVEIDYTIKVGFEAVVRIVDELDGIEIYSDTAMTLNSNGEKCTYIEGKQQINGNCALRFARERKTYGTGDIHRGANQQEVLTAIINKMSSSRDYYLKLPEVMDAASDLFETSLSEDDITKFIRMQLSNQTKWQTESIALSGKSDMLPTYSMGNNLPLYVMHPDEGSLNTMREKINEYLNVE